LTVAEIVSTAALTRCWLLADDGGIREFGVR
jgi:hypothetical protein